ncbi:hypothetical protein CTH_1941 [Carboxydocella thermautotrophica]|nr:hypothetical protein CTH_1941 [Carboxydocella thermautotrophica]
MIKPPKLQAGDKVAAITLSWGGPGVYRHRYEAGKKQFEETFKVKEKINKPCTFAQENHIYLIGQSLKYSKEVRE